MWLVLSYISPLYEIDVYIWDLMMYNGRVVKTEVVAPALTNPKELPVRTRVPNLLARLLPVGVGEPYRPAM